MDSWKTDWDFLEAIRRDLRGLSASSRGERTAWSTALDYRAFHLPAFHTAAPSKSVIVGAMLASTQR
jgi:hypothetical protein